MREEEFEKLKEKARKYDDLEKIVASFYVDENGDEKEENDEDGGLMGIGEKVAHFFGWI